MAFKDRIGIDLGRSIALEEPHLEDVDARTTLRTDELADIG